MKLRQLLLLLFGCVQLEAVIVKTSKGLLEGLTKKVLGKDIYQFWGVPFAQPPVGSLRFKRPKPVQSWEPRTLQALNKPNSCPQIVDTMFPGFKGAQMWNPNTEMSEDCLYLNIFAPRHAQHSAVMVWIYGGGFFSGSASLDVYDAQILSAYTDVIVVLVQYRVAALGFATMGEDKMPGNMGLYDQLMALDWIQQNIKFFGGDPFNVTLFGESAGSASISLHLFSPLSRSRFQRAIMESGSGLANWAVITEEEGILRTRRLAKEMGCPYHSRTVRNTQIIECLKRKSALDIQEAWVTRGFNQFPFVPVLDGVFLTEDLHSLAKRKNFKHAPVMMGFNSNEGTYFMLYFQPNIFNTSKNIGLTEDEFDRAIDLFFKYHPRYPDRLSQIGRDAIRFEYKHWPDPNSKPINQLQLDQATGDLHFTCPVIRLAEHMSEVEDNVYLYKFDHRSSIHPWYDWVGVMHADEINFVFGEPLRPEFGYKEEEVVLAKRMMKYWSSFAKTGDPNYDPSSAQGAGDEWPKFDTKRKHYLLLNTDSNKNPKEGISRSPKSKECSFWLNYLPKLLMETKNITDTEQEWKMEFHEWKTKYMVEWKKMYEDFVGAKNYCTTD